MDSGVGRSGKRQQRFRGWKAEGRVMDSRLKDPEPWASGREQGSSSEDSGLSGSRLLWSGVGEGGKRRELVEILMRREQAPGPPLACIIWIKITKLKVRKDKLKDKEIRSRHIIKR